MGYASKSFCKGILCNRQDRKNTCVHCKKWICGRCMYYIHGKTYCPDCGLDMDLKRLKDKLKFKSVIKNDMQKTTQVKA